MTSTEALEFINATIKSNGMEEEVRAWKKKYNKANSEEEGINGGGVGKRYWSNFLSRHPALATKTSTRFDANREEWCNVRNFERMYEECYEKMVESGVAFKTPEEVWLDQGSCCGRRE